MSFTVIKSNSTLHCIDSNTTRNFKLQFPNGIFILTRKFIFILENEILYFYNSEKENSVLLLKEVYKAKVVENIDGNFLFVISDFKLFRINLDENIQNTNNFTPEKIFIGNASNLFLTPSYLMYWNESENETNLKTLMFGDEIKNIINLPFKIEDVAQCSLKILLLDSKFNIHILNAEKNQLEGGLKSIGKVLAFAASQNMPLVAIALKDSVVVLNCEAKEVFQTISIGGCQKLEFKDASLLVQCRNIIYEYDFGSEKIKVIYEGVIDQWQFYKGEALTNKNNNNIINEDLLLLRADFVKEIYELRRENYELRKELENLKKDVDDIKRA